ncbi:hypothetical protein GEMRC1_008835 [Eukaryota sp. GEM-RC1]
MSTLHHASQKLLNDAMSLIDSKSFEAAYCSLIRCFSLCTYLSDRSSDSILDNVSDLMSVVRTQLESAPTTFGIEDYDELIKSLQPQTMYNPLCDLLCHERKSMKRKLQIFNNHVDSLDRDLSSIFGYVGKKFYVESRLLCDYGSNIFVGDNFYANYDTVLLDCGLICIGNNVMLGPSVHIYSVNHPLCPQERNTLREYTKPVVIEDDCWIGGRTVICPGVRIGRGTTIAAGSVVTTDIPSGVLAAGCPAVVKKQI